MLHPLAQEEVVEHRPRDGDEAHEGREALQEGQQGADDESCKGIVVNEEAEGGEEEDEERIETSET